MTILLDQIYLGNSQLFRTSVYDIDGVTLLTPTSVKCTVVRLSDDVLVVNEQDGTVGLGFAQYNWSGSASETGRFRGLLTVTISVGVVKTEEFEVEVLPKPSEFVLDTSTALGQTRLLIPDTNPQKLRFTDAEISAFLTMSYSSPATAAALALETIAGLYLQNGLITRVADRQMDAKGIAEALMKRAADLRANAEDIDASLSGDVEDLSGVLIAENVVDEFSWRRWILRDSTEV